MRLTITAVVMIALVAAGTVRSTVHAQLPATRTAAGGMYTVEQAKRGAAVYDENCSPCHGATLLGGAGDAPALADRSFIAAWSKKPLADLFDRITTTMPQGGEGSLSPEQYADVLAFILQANKFPAGQTELPHTAEALKLLRLEAGDQP